jgi:hypothetical protein
MSRLTDVSRDAGIQHPFSPHPSPPSLRTLSSPTPLNIPTFCSDSPDMPETISGAEIFKKLTPSCPAIAFARRVLPQPGGPWRRMPLGGSTPKCV